MSNKLMIGSSKNSTENYPRKCFWTQEKETWVKFNPELSANRPSNNWALVYKQISQLRGTVHSTKIPTGPTGKIGPPQKVDPFFRNFSCWTEPIHWVLDRNFRKFWLNGSRPGLPYHPGQLYQLYWRVSSCVTFFVTSRIWNKTM